MKAITLWQPWASLIITGAKTIETRSWATNIRGTIAIHAAKKRDERSLELLDTPAFQEGLKIYDDCQRGRVFITDISFGKVLGTIEIVDCKPVEELTKEEIKKQLPFGDFSPGRYGWILRNPVMFKKPIPMKGKQGFWNWN